jgi:alpha-glucosidase (family GH31 glycosyl hydrolase)
VAVVKQESHGNGEHFGGHHDTVPLGPRSVGMDFAFPCAKDVYGIPEHTTPLSLPTTSGEGARYSQPYRLYNLDVFEYELQETMALYGNIPVMWAHGTCPQALPTTTTTTTVSDCILSPFLFQSLTSSVCVCVRACLHQLTGHLLVQSLGDLCGRICSAAG